MLKVLQNNSKLFSLIISLIEFVLYFLRHRPRESFTREYVT